MIYERITSNKRKSILLAFLFFLFILFLGYVFGELVGISWFGILITGVLLLILIPCQYYRGDRVILKMSGARPAEKKEFPYLINTVEGLSIAAGLSVPKIYVIDDTAINAFATGRNPAHASITVTTGAVNRLNRVELEGVIAHEMSHIKNYDVRLMMLIVVMVGITILISDFILRTMRFREVRGRGGAALVLAGVVLAITAPIVAYLIHFAISRKREFLADADGALLSRYPEGLASALEKIKNDKEPLVEVANRATASLYISNPLRGGKGFLTNLFSTHPPLEERIKALREM